MLLIESLIVASEKAANVARVCRNEKHLFKLLVQEKGAGEGNPRFVQDFKTLADVLIQEMVKYDIEKQFPEMRNHIKGEEDNAFSNKLGQTVYVEIQNCEQDTAKVLENVLNGDETAAILLATEVHKTVSLREVNITEPVAKVPDITCSSLGVWIDPIDSTAEYISGQEVVDKTGLHLTGLQCVTVLIGVYDRNTGHPVMGVINQPFFEQQGDRWRGRCFWGVSTPSKSISSLTVSSPPTGIVCVSSSEDEEVKRKLKAKGLVVVEPAGAGYKILTVIAGLADVYILSKGSTYKWDTCGPHAILKSLGGDVVQYSDAVGNSLVNVSYKDDYSEGGSKIDKYCNVCGIIAYRNTDVFKEILTAFVIEDIQ